MAIRRTAIVSTAPIDGPLFKGGGERTLSVTYHILRGLVPECVVSSDVYSSQVRGADVVISSDQALPPEVQSRPQRHVLALSNLAYSNQRQAALSQLWNRVWVPSDYLKRQLIQEFGLDATRIDVLPPVIDFPDGNGYAPLLPDGASRPSVLFPHRSDPRKGLLEALSLVRRLAAIDKRWQLVVTAPSAYDDPENRAYFEHAIRYDALAGEHIAIIPWQPYAVMTHLYQAATCTLFASALPESFGLVIAESVACGTPAVATRVGALVEHRFPGLHLVDKIDSDRTARLMTRLRTARVPKSERNHVRALFSAAAHESALRGALAALHQESP